jgi:L-lactate permease
MEVLSRIIAAILSILVLIASFFVGAVVALVALGLIVIGWLAFAIRWWQLKRQARSSGTTQSETIEGEYRVVHKHEDDR